MPGTVEAFVILLLLVAPGFLCWSFLGARIPRVFCERQRYTIGAWLNGDKIRALHFYRVEEEVPA